MKGYAHVRSPVVAYLEEGPTKEAFISVRSSLENLTKIITINRTNLWAFKMLPKITKLFADPNYPKFEPNTITSGFPCATAAKYEYTKNASVENYFHTKYITWMDMGYLRRRLSGPPAKMHTPQDMRDDKIAYLELYPMRKPKPTPKDVFYNNTNYLASGFFIGTIENMIQWCDNYMNYSDQFLNRGLAGADQQVLYAMLRADSELIRKVQVYNTWNMPARAGSWFALGLHCLDPPATRKYPQTLHGPNLI